MKFKMSQIRQYILYMMIFYILNKNFWDLIFGSLTKNLYYSLVFLGTICCFYRYLSQKRMRTIFILFSLYCIIVFCNGVFLSNTEQFSVGIIEYISYPFSFFALLYFMKDQTEYFNLFNKIMAWGALTSILAIYEFIVKKPVLPGSEGMIYTFDNGASSYRSTVFIGSPMMLGVVLAAIFILTLYYYYLYRNRRYFFYLTFDLLGILCTGSRGPLIGCLIGACVMYYFLCKNDGMSRNVFVLTMLIIVITAIIIMTKMIFPSFSFGIETLDFMIYRVTSALNFSTEWGNVERLNRWTYYISKFIEKPFVGYGIATTSAAVKTNIAVTTHGITTESGVLARLVETGIIGFVSYLLFFIEVVKQAFLSKNEGDRSKLFVIGIVVLFTIEDMVLQISLDLFCTFILWFALAYIYNLEMNVSERKMVKSDSKK